MYKSKYDAELELLRAEQVYRASAHHEAREIVTHYSTPVVALTIPLLQSAITALLLSVLVMIASHHFSWGRWYQVGAVSFIAILALDWLRRSEAWRKSIYALEELLQRDLSLDGFIGEPEEPEPVRETVELIITHEESGRRQWVEFGISRAKLAELASDVCYGAAFSELSLSGAGALLSRDEFRAVRDTMLKRELLEWKSHEHRNLGTQFTDSGWRVLRMLAAEHRNTHPSQVKLPVESESAPTTPLR